MSLSVGPITLLVTLCFIIIIMQVVNCNEFEDNKSHSKIRRRRRRPNKRKTYQYIADESKLNALSIKFPVSLLDSDSDWRSIRINRLEDSIKSSYLTDPSKFKAQDKEDLWLYENWFYGMKNGVIIESGALDGISLSTSYFFEHFANWTTIHIEGDPENFQKLQFNRPESINIHCGVCQEPQTLHYSNISISSVRGFIEFMSPAFLKKWHGRLFRNVTSIDQLPKVQCVPMRFILKLLMVPVVDIWVLDVEGAEEQALLGTDFQSVRINTVAMECDETDVERNRRKTEILEANGYTCLTVQRNCMCRRSDFLPSSSTSSSSSSTSTANLVF